MSPEEKLREMGLPEGLYCSVRNWGGLNSARLNLDRRVPKCGAARQGFVPVTADLESAITTVKKVAPSDASDGAHVLRADVHAWSHRRHERRSPEVLIPDKVPQVAGDDVYQCESPVLITDSAEGLVAQTLASVVEGMDSLSVTSKDLHTQVTRELFTNMQNRVGGLIDI